MQSNYQPSQIEHDVQNFWEQNQSFHVSEDPKKEKFYCLSMIPYPSGDLHMGHVRNYMLGDIIARYQRMKGKNVLQPIGWDAFGLPAENAALKHQVPPSEWTYKNISDMQRQLKELGFGYDWQREIATSQPDYYRWEQWLFLQLYKKGLAYRKKVTVNWDPVDNTVLANEQVIDGRGWRSGALVERREITQWFLKITAYAEQLLNDLRLLNGWPEQVRVMQENWIGRSQGLDIHFEVKDSNQQLTVYTTRPDTLMGATFLAIAPQHPLATLAAEKNPKVTEFIEKCKHIKVAEYEMATMEKEGLDSGWYAIHPLTQKTIPVWVTNYVVMDYGSGAVMAVPAHDQRDYEFAKKYNLAIEQVISGDEQELAQKAITEKGILINSGAYSGLSFEQAFDAIAQDLAHQQKAERRINYRLRDWGISRQRYWGTPIPMIYCEKCEIVPVPEQDLPVRLPENIILDGPSSPLINIPEFYNTQCPQCGGPAHRETDTFDTFMESSWYYVRFASYDQQHSMVDDRAKYWMGVDQYIGGIEHAVLHLLYARFIYKVLRDEGLVQGDEPFIKLLTQGMVLKNGVKMSKSKGNTVSPKDLIQQYGADTVRLFSIFASPPEQSLEWSDSGVEGSYRYMKRLWAWTFQVQHLILNHPKTEIIHSKLTEQQQQWRKEVHEILQQATQDMERLQLNTVVSAAMKLLNHLNKIPVDSPDANSIIYEGCKILLSILAPITPHVAQHLWKHLGFGENILDATWPKVDPAALQAATVTMVVQINGKVRANISVPSTADDAGIKEQALADAQVQKHLNQQQPKKIIVVPKKLISIVV